MFNSYTSCYKTTCSSNSSTVRKKKSRIKVICTAIYTTYPCDSQKVHAHTTTLLTSLRKSSTKWHGHKWWLPTCNVQQQDLLLHLLSLEQYALPPLILKIVLVSLVHRGQAMQCTSNGKLFLELLVTVKNLKIQKSSLYTRRRLPYFLNKNSVAFIYVLQLK